MDTISNANMQAQMATAMQSGQNGKISALQNTLKGADDKTLERTREAAEEFEAVFISQMMQHMFEGVDVDPMFGGGKGEEMFRSMMVEEYGKNLAAKGGIGIADQVQAKLIEMQANLR